MTGMLELGAVGAMTSALVEVGKRRLPAAFTSDVNVLWVVGVFTVLNAVNAMIFGGDVRQAVSDGVVSGLALAGLYRGVSAAAKKNSVDLSKQVDMRAIAEMQSVADAEDVVEPRPIGFHS